jgi:cyclopropane-fatty-acyl-phospholipid synthase
MKKALKNIAEMMHQSDPKACFAIEFWDGDAMRFGDVPRVTLRLKTKNAARSIIGKGFLGFGESYMEGDLDIENDIQELFRLGLVIDFDEYRLPFRQNFRFFILSLLNRDSLRRAPKNISYHYGQGDEFYELYLNRRQRLMPRLLKTLSFMTIH